MQFTLRLLRSTVDSIPIERQIERDTIGEAVDAVVRWLRITRNIGSVDAPLPTRWELDAHTGTGVRRAILSGDMTTTHGR